MILAQGIGKGATRWVKSRGMVSRISSPSFKVFYKLLWGYICKVGKDGESLIFGSQMHKPRIADLGPGPKEPMEFSIQDGLHSLPSHARQVFSTVFFWIPVLMTHDDT